MKNSKKYLNFIYWFIFVIIILIAALAWLSVYEGETYLKIFIVRSGSMEPAIKTGSLVFDLPQPEYKKDDVITYKVSKTLITHRIASVDSVTGEKIFTTRGDANNISDYNKVTQSQILGKVIFSVPYLGYLTEYAKTKNGIILLVVIPATIIVYSELISIKNEVAELLAERKKRKLTPVEEVELGIGEEEIKAEKWYHRLLKKFKK